MKIHFKIQGTGVPLLLFHGWGFDHHIWSSLASEISSQYRLYLIDLPGFGLTPSMPWAIFKKELLEQLPTYFAVAGWSMGGLFATRLALEEPQRVSHLLNIASSPRFIRGLDWPGIDIEIFKSFYQNLATHPQRTLQEFIRLQLQGQIIPEDFIKHSPSIAGLQAGLDLLLHWDFRSELEQLTTPVCYIFGRLDAITPRATMTMMEKRYPNFNYHLFPKAAHAPFLSHPEHFIDVLQGFLS